MKRIFSLLFSLALAVTALAQTPEEILSRMEEEMDKHENDGIAMTVDVKVPIVGTMTTKSYTKGNKVRVDARMLGVDMITWSDDQTQWTYTSKKGKNQKVVIETIDNTKAKTSNEAGDTKMFNGIADDYDVAITKETKDAWYITATKKGEDQDSPKTMDIVVAKGSYLPLSLTASMTGLTMTMYDISFGVDDKTVTFCAEDYPKIKIEDKR